MRHLLLPSRICVQDSRRVCFLRLVPLHALCVLASVPFFGLVLPLCCFTITMLSMAPMHGVARVVF